LRARAHRLLLAAALLTVLLTTAVLTTLTAYSGAIGDAALQHSLNDSRNAADTALVVKADVPPAERAAADTAVRKAAGKTFDGLPVTVRTPGAVGAVRPASLAPAARRAVRGPGSHLLRGPGPDAGAAGVGPVPTGDVLGRHRGPRCPAPPPRTSV